MTDYQRKLLEHAFKRGYDAGFGRSCEGWNGEWPWNGRSVDDEDRKHYDDECQQALEEFMREQDAEVER